MESEVKSIEIHERYYKETEQNKNRVGRRSEVGMEKKKRREERRGKGG